MYSSNETTFETGNTTNPANSTDLDNDLDAVDSTSNVPPSILPTLPSTNPFTTASTRLSEDDFNAGDSTSDVPVLITMPIIPQKNSELTEPFPTDAMKPPRRRFDFSTKPNFLANKTEYMLPDSGFSLNDSYTSETLGGCCISSSYGFLILGMFLIFGLAILWFCYVIFLCIKKSEETKCEKKMKAYHEEFGVNAHYTAGSKKAYGFQPESMNSVFPGARDERALPSHANVHGRVTTDADAIASVVTFVAANPVNDDDLFLRPPRQDVFLAPKDLSSMPLAVRFANVQSKSNAQNENIENDSNQSSVPINNEEMVIYKEDAHHTRSAPRKVKRQR